jgi:hypothetical protein
MHLPHLRNPPFSWPPGLPFFSNQILQHRDVERLISHYPLEL